MSYTCYNEDGTIRACTAAELGEHYFQAQQDIAGWSDTNPNPWQYDLYQNFWEPVVSPYIDSMNEEYGTDFTTGQFLQGYGHLLPQDFSAGPASLNRATRVADLEKGQFLDQFSRQKETQLQNIGASGFSGSGMAMNTGEDLWNQYARQARGLQLQEEASYQDIYASQGNLIYNQLANLALTGAFTDPEASGAWGDTLTTEQTTDCVMDCMENVSGNPAEYVEALADCINQCGGA